MTAQNSLVDLVHLAMDRGIPDRSVAERALRATLRVLGERLTEDEAHALASRLPDELAGVVDRAEYDSDFDAAELYARVGRRMHVDLGEAHERADVALRVIGTVLDDDLRRRLAHALPVPIAERLYEPELGEPPPYQEATTAPRMTTLASGRPGSRHPLADAPPPDGHTQSIAQNDDPHGETKLSSARGLTQERFDDSLAKGRPPGPLRPVAEAKDKT
jgi:uncharacterized protein (DUF2267 family)